jgi:hypothetical protein
MEVPRKLCGNPLMTKNLIIAILILIVILCLTLGGRGYKYYEDKLEQQSIEKRERIRVLEEVSEVQKRQLDSVRTVLGNHIDSLNIHSEILNSRIETTTSELKAIKGKYNNRTVSELEAEMERRANVKK